MFETYLADTKTKIEQAQTTILSDWEKSVFTNSSQLTKITSHFLTAAEGGKRLRGSLVRLGYELAGGKNVDNIYSPAAAFEIFQTAILAHDDIIDQSPTRRGRPTLHFALGADHYAISQAICLGDIGFFLAYQVLANSDFPDAQKNLAINVFSKLMIETGEGEMLDVYLPKDPNPTEDDVLKIGLLKTARYTITGPLQLGASLAGADQAYLDKLQQFGDDLGVAFQIQDDILGVFGNEEIIGKSASSDIEEGKITVLYLYALDHAEEDQKNVLLSYGKSNITSDQLTAIRRVLTDTGALEYAKTLADKYVSKSAKLINEITTNPHHQALLREMSDFLINRDK